MNKTEINIKIASSDVGKAESHLHILRGLLNYHERMMLFRDCPARSVETECKNKECTNGKCPNIVDMDIYAEALREAIRCVEIVNEVNQ